MTRDELLRDLDAATRAGDVELARAIDQKLSGLSRQSQGVGFTGAFGRRLKEIGTLGLVTDRQKGGVMSPDHDPTLEPDYVQTPSEFAGTAAADLLSMIGGGGVLKLGGKAIGAAAPRIASALQTTGQALTLPKGVAQAAGGGALWGLATTPGGIGDRIAAGAFGAGGGSLGYAGPRAISSLIKPTPSADVAELAARGIRMTPGQIIGGRVNEAEQKLMSVPVVGDLIKRSRGKSLDDFNRAAFNEAVAPINAKLDAPVGRELVRQAYDKVEDAYAKVIPKLSLARDIDLEQRIAAIRQTLPASKAADFDQFVTDKLLSRFDQQSRLSGDAFKQAESELKRLARTYSRAADADQNLLGEALHEVRDAMVDVAAKYSPKRAIAGMAKADLAYAKLERTAGAAGMVGAKQGVISPSQLLNQARSQSGGKRGMQFRKGEALMQDLAERADPILSTNFPNSGTTDRLLLGGGLLGGAAMIDPSLLTAIGLSSALASPPARSAFQWLATHQTQSPILLEMAKRSRQLARPMGLIGAASAPAALLVAE